VKKFCIVFLLILSNFILLKASQVESESILPLDIDLDSNDTIQTNSNQSNSIVTPEELDHLFKYGSNLILKSGNDQEVTISFGNGIENTDQDHSINKVEIINENKSIFSKIINYWSKNEKKVNYNFGSMTSNIPYRLYLIIEQLKKNKFYLNRLILHGPPGNGKSTLVKQIAKEIKAGLIEVSGPTIVNKYQGSGAEKIETIFSIADKASQAVKIVVFIDEIDAIAEITNESNSKDYVSAVQTLWLWLDKIKKNKNIMVIFATNKLLNLHPTLVDRFGDNVFEISNPNARRRKEIILHYNNNIEFENGFKLDEESINYLVKTSENLSIRAVEDVVNSILNEANIRDDEFKIVEIIDESVTRKKKAVAQTSKLERIGKIIQPYFNGTYHALHFVLMVSQLLNSKIIPTSVQKSV